MRRATLSGSSALSCGIAQRAEDSAAHPHRNPGCSLESFPAPQVHSFGTRLAPRAIHGCPASIPHCAKPRYSQPERALMLNRTLSPALQLATLPVTSESPQSAAINRRSRCGVVRGWPVLSSHFCPGAAPQVGQRTASTSFGLSSFFIANLRHERGRFGYFGKRKLPTGSKLCWQPTWGDFPGSG
jgi:hypothetical protein